MAQLSIISVFEKGTHSNTSSVIYTRDSNGVFFFAMGRKLPANARKRLDSTGNMGPAGTDVKYAGKWGFFGGSKKQSSKHDLEASINEIRDEANIPTLESTDVSISWMEYTPCAPQTLKLVKACEFNSSTVGFIYFIEDSKYFFDLFPQWPLTRGGVDIVMSSHCEIDLVSSLSMERLSKLQQTEIAGGGDNFIISYCANSLNNIVIPFISEKSDEFKKKWGNGIQVVPDTAPRQCYLQSLYTEIKPRVYV